MQPEKRETLKAVGFFTAVRLGDAGMGAIAAWLISSQAGGGYSPFQVFFFYSAVGFLCMLPWALRQSKKLASNRKRLHLLRALFEFSSFVLVFYSLQHLELYKQTALSFAGPLFGTVLAILLLGEKGSRQTWLSLLLGIVGMLIITRPGTIPLNIGVFYTLLGSLGFAFCGIYIKWLTKTEPAQRIAFYMLGLTALLSLPFALAHWKAPSPEAWGWLIAIGIIGWSQQVLVAAAIAKVPLIVLMPLNFLRLVFVAILSYVIFHQIIDRATLIGAVVILAAAIYDAWAATTKANKRNAAA